MNPVTELKKMLEEMEEAETGRKSPRMKDIRVRRDVADKLEAWKKSWGDKTLTDALDRALTMAKGELQSLVDDLEE
jgi:hypothetical protein